MTGDTDDAGVGQVPTEGRPIFRRLYLTWNGQKLSLSGDLNEFVRRMGRLSEILQSGDLYDRAYVDRLVLWHLGRLDGMRLDPKNIPMSSYFQGLARRET